MEKSLERKKLEEEIKAVYKKSREIAMNMIKDEFNGNMDAALSNKDFVKRMHEKIMLLWKKYHNGYKKLERLEKEEGFPAMKFYASQLDLIAKHLPDSSKEICYYPFSGVDFYWARIFKKIICEDISFGKSKLPNMWWDYETYQKKDEIVSLLKEKDIILQDSQLEFIVGDAYLEKKENSRLNNPFVTLLIKGGHNVLEYIEKRFDKEPLLFGAIITVTSANPLKNMEKKFKKERYKKVFSYKGEDFCIPYALSLRNVYVFVKKFS